MLWEKPPHIWWAGGRRSLWTVKGPSLACRPTLGETGFSPYREWTTEFPFQPLFDVSGDCERPECMTPIFRVVLRSSFERWFLWERRGQNFKVRIERGRQEGEARERESGFEGLGSWKMDRETQQQERGWKCLLCWKHKLVLYCLLLEIILLTFWFNINIKTVTSIFRPVTGSCWLIPRKVFKISFWTLILATCIYFLPEATYEMLSLSLPL